jgi:hypothetical protein
VSESGPIPWYERRPVLVSTISTAILAVGVLLATPFVDATWPTRVGSFLAGPWIRLVLLAMSLGGVFSIGYVLGRRRRPYSGPLFQIDRAPSVGQAGTAGAQERDAARRARIQAWREAIEAADFSQAGHGGFGDSAAYSSLRPYLDADFVRAFEGRTASFGADGRGQYGAKHDLLDAVARIERDWGLV